MGENDLMNLAGKTFRAVSNSSNGSLNTQTEMHFTNDDGVIVVGNYGGGSIATGHVLGRRDDQGQLTLLYQGATTAGEIQAGQASASFTVDEAKASRMHLEWRWLTGDGSSGRSEWVEA